MDEGEPEVELPGAGQFWLAVWLPFPCQPGMDWLSVAVFSLTACLSLLASLASRGLAPQGWFWMLPLVVVVATFSSIISGGLFKCPESSGVHTRMGACLTIHGTTGANWMVFTKMGHWSTTDTSSPTGSCIACNREGHTHLGGALHLLSSAV